MAVCCKTSKVQGDVTLGDGCVLHPTSRVHAAEGASISIGAGCVLEELSVIEAPPGASVVIGEGNLFEVGCCVRAATVGAFNVFGIKSDVGSGATIGSGCKVGACAHVPKNSSVEDSEAIFRNGLNGEQATGRAPRALEEHRVSLKLYRESLVAPSSRFAKEHGCA